jgi:hypothetical protein
MNPQKTVGFSDMFCGSVGRILGLHFLCTRRVKAEKKAPHDGMRGFVK